MAKYIDIDNRKEFVEALCGLLAKCKYKHKEGCLAPSCEECIDRNFDFLGHLLPAVDVAPAPRTAMKIKVTATSVIRTFDRDEGEAVYEKYFKILKAFPREITADGLFITVPSLESLIDLAKATPFTEIIFKGDDVLEIEIYDTYRE